MRPARGRGWIVVVHWGLVQLGRHGQARCALRLRPRAATTVRPERVVHVCSSGHSLAPPGSSQAPRPAGARSGRGGRQGRRERAARAAGARVLGADLPPPRQPGSPRAGRRACAKALCCRSGGASHGRRPPPPPGGGSRRHRRLRGRRHLPRRHLFSSVDRCGRTSHAPHTPVTSPTPPRV